MVQVHPVKAGKGLSWIARGWGVFKRSPLMWTALASIWFVVFMSLGNTGFGGGLVAWLLSPVTLAGLLYSAREVEQGRPIQFVHLIQAFRDTRTLVQLSVIGAILALMAIASVVIGNMFIGHETLARMQTDPGSVSLLALGNKALLGFLLVFLLQLVVFTAVAYAIPLVLLKGVTAWQGIVASLYASLRNVVALTVFAVVYLLLVLAVSIPLVIVMAILFSPTALMWFPVVLMWLLLPTSLGMWYVSYQDNFGD